MDLEEKRRGGRGLGGMEGEGGSSWDVFYERRINLKKSFLEDFITP